MDKKYFKEKLEWEWKLFLQEMMSQSKENLISLAEMIVLKKRIYLILRKSEFTEKELTVLLSYNNMLDSLCLEFSTQDHTERMLENIHSVLCN